MSTMEMYSHSIRDMEDTADQVKAMVLRAMVNDGTLSEEVADNWAGSHTVLYRKKGFFRTVCDKWWNTKAEPNTDHIIIVTLVPYVKLPSQESEASDAKPS